LAVVSRPRLPDLDFEAMTAEELIAWAHQFFWPRLCLTCSWQKQSSVLVHMVAELGLRMDTVELDTHLFFRESYETRERLVERYQLRLIQPEIPTVAEQHRAEGPNLWERDPDRCCNIRKVRPLTKLLHGLDAWVTGLRRDQWASRSDIRKVEVDHDHDAIVKLNPLAEWTEDDVWDYLRENDVPVHGLYEQGYTSIGCAPCTRPVAAGEPVRAGRWWWESDAPKECGMHCAIETGGFEHELHAILGDEAHA